MFAGEFYVATVFDVSTAGKESACLSTCFQEASYRMTGLDGSDAAGTTTIMVAASHEAVPLTAYLISRVPNR
jgi:hypothetical protein